MDKVKKAFAQVMMCRKVLPWSEAGSILNGIASEFNPSKNGAADEYELQPAVDEINDRLRDLKMQLKDTICEVSGKRYLILVITVETPISRISSKYTRNELQLFQEILDEIVTSNNGCALMNTCINLNSSLPEDMSKSSAEAVIERFVADKWFIGEKGSVYLGARCIAELEPVLRDLYKDYIGDCPLCQQLAIVGKKCNSCFCRMHNHCFEKYSMKKSGGTLSQCLKCGNDRSGPQEGSED